MAVPYAAFNYSSDAVQRSTGSVPQNMYATAQSDNVPTALDCSAVVLPVPNNAATAIPVSVFSLGSGVYTVYCDVSGTTGYDLAGTGRVTVVNGVITNSTGFICQQTQAPVVAQGPPVTVTQAVAVLANIGNLGAQSPAIFQTSGGALSYTIIATKLAN